MWRRTARSLPGSKRPPPHSQTRWISSRASTTVGSRRPGRTSMAASASVRAKRVRRSVRYAAAGASSSVRPPNALRVTRAKKRGSNPGSTRPSLADPWPTVAGSARLRAMVFRGGDRMDDAELDLRGPDLVRPRRPWALMVAALLLVVLVAVLWAKWSESRGDVERLRAELKTVYAEAESLRTQAAQVQQRVALLEK